MRCGEQELTPTFHLIILIEKESYCVSVRSVTLRRWPKVIPSKYFKSLNKRKRVRTSQCIQQTYSTNVNDSLLTPVPLSDPLTLLVPYKHHEYPVKTHRKSLRKVNRSPRQEDYISCLTNHLDTGEERWRLDRVGE